MKTINLKDKIDIEILSDKNFNFQKKEGQEFYYSPSRKTVHLAEQLPNGDYWIVKTWRKSSILLMR